MFVMQSFEIKTRIKIFVFLKMQVFQIHPRQYYFVQKDLLFEKKSYLFRVFQIFMDFELYVPQK